MDSLVPKERKDSFSTPFKISLLNSVSENYLRGDHNGLNTKWSRSVAYLKLLVYWCFEEWTCHLFQSSASFSVCSNTLTNQED